MKQPKTTGEHIIDIQGHIKGVKREVYHLKITQEHMHKDIDKLGGQIDKIYWVILAAVGAVALEIFILFGTNLV
jgi:uncharacterized coiled-coil DUF342 family protein